MDGLCRCQTWQALAKTQLDVQADGGTSENLCLFGLHLRASCWGLEHTGWLVGMPIWHKGTYGGPFASMNSEKPERVTACGISA